jgi:hypothetical protein
VKATEASSLFIFFFFQIKFKEAGIYQTHHRQLRDADGGLVNSLFLFPLYYK